MSSSLLTGRGCVVERRNGKRKRGVGRHLPYDGRRAPSLRACPRAGARELRSPEQRAPWRSPTTRPIDCLSRRGESPQACLESHHLWVSAASGRQPAEDCQRTAVSFVCAIARRRHPSFRSAHPDRASGSGGRPSGSRSDNKGGWLVAGTRATNVWPSFTSVTGWKGQQFGMC